MTTKRRGVLSVAIICAALSMGCVGAGPRCWNEREGEGLVTNGRVVRTCCQEYSAGVFPFAEPEIIGPVTCTTAKELRDDR